MTHISDTREPREPNQSHQTNSATTRSTIVLQTERLDDSCFQSLRIKRSMKYDLQDVVLQQKRNGESGATMNGFVVDAIQKAISAYMESENET